jgi:hypothetical protein
VDTGPFWELFPIPFPPLSAIVELVTIRLLLKLPIP